MTAPERQLDRLPERAEALLDGWPAPGRGALEWEDAAARTMERVRETPIGSTPDLLLEAPMAEESGEGSLSPPAELSADEPPEAEDEPPMLANIARAVVASTAGASPKEVAREMMLAAEEGRRSAPPVPPSRQVYAGGSRVESRAGSPHTAPVQAMHEATARSELPAPEPQQKRSPLGFIALGGGAALALAAGAALYVSVRGEARSVLTDPSAEAPQAIARATTTAEAPAEPKAAPAPSAIALDILPAAPGKAEPEMPSKSAAPTPLSGLAKESLAFRMKNAPAGGGKLVLEERNDDPEPAQAPAAPQDTPATPAPQGGKPRATEEPGLPPQPSLGAVQAAVGSVMTGARSCLAGQDAGSKATVKFGPAGRVLSVVLSGPAAGTPAESCVRSALMGARVPPFSEPSFSASLTIRPP